MVMFLLNVYFFPGILALASLSFIRSAYDEKLSFHFAYDYSFEPREHYKDHKFSCHGDIMIFDRENEIIKIFPCFLIEKQLNELSSLSEPKNKHCTFIMYGLCLVGYHDESRISCCFDLFKNKGISSWAWDIVASSIPAFFISLMISLSMYPSKYRTAIFYDATFCNLFVPLFLLICSFFLVYLHCFPNRDKETLKAYVDNHRLYKHNLKFTEFKLP